MEKSALSTGNFADSLIAQGRSSEIPESADAYGWLIGSWEIDIDHYFQNVKDKGLKGEINFSWILEGRAVQDTWISPRRFERVGEIDPICNMCGITLRVWDPAIQAWRITWINPATNARSELIGRWVDNEVVQLGVNADGRPSRWLFTDITPDSFRWVGESLLDDGKTWKLGGQFYARRIC